MSELEKQSPEKGLMREEFEFLNSKEKYMLVWFSYSKRAVYSKQKFVIM